MCVERGAVAPYFVQMMTTKRKARAEKKTTAQASLTLCKKSKAHFYFYDFTQNDFSHHIIISVRFVIYCMRFSFFTTAVIPFDISIQLLKYICRRVNRNQSKPYA